MIDLKEKVVVITGAANGLGKALAIEFFKQGCHLALIDIDMVGLENLKNELKSTQQKITTYALDISDDKSWLI